MTEFRMPSLGADMEAGTLVEWQIKPGQRVKRGDVVAVVETQKGAVEVEIWDEGVVDQLLVEPGTKVPVGEVLARLHTEGEVLAPAAPSAPAAAPPRAAPKPAGPPAPPPVAHVARFKVSPVARRRAEELGVDLSLVTPSGPEGVISMADVEQAAQAKPVAGARPAALDKLVAMRQAIAAAMAKSKREIPHYYLGTKIDVSRASAWLEQENAKRPVTQRVLFAAVLLKAAAVALKEVPELNGFWVDGAFKPVQAVHLGVGIGLRGGGLVAPAIHDAEVKSLLEMMQALSDLVTRARSGALRSSELSDATVTVTNLGEQGVETVYGVIYPPQVALVGFGKVVERPWAESGGLYVRRVIHATLCADHRASVGHRGALFLSALDRMLQEPEKL
jgi:pyruvate dehydrogenase E2 component (dihydrolipoamide acetyltransferase)